jgi:hypothetical protein
MDRLLFATKVGSAGAVEALSEAEWAELPSSALPMPPPLGAYPVEPRPHRRYAKNPRQDWRFVPPKLGIVALRAPVEWN